MLSKKNIFVAFAFLATIFGMGTTAKAQMQSVTLTLDSSKTVNVTTSRKFTGAFNVVLSSQQPTQAPGGSYSNCPQSGSASFSHLSGLYTLAVTAATNCGGPMLPAMLTTTDNVTFSTGDGNTGETIMITIGAGANSGWRDRDH
jgi:hypothetical protein